MLWGARLDRQARCVLWSVLGSSAAYAMALLGSEGIWGGVRHAMPLVVALCIPAGAAVAQAWTLRARTLESAARIAVVGLLLIGAAVMTLGEKRRCWVPQNLAYKGQAGRPAGTVRRMARSMSPASGG
jgi:hypothetical protein